MKVHTNRWMIPTVCLFLLLGMMTASLSACGTGGSTSGKDTITAHAVIKAWFAAFETGDYDGMRPYCTEAFQEQFFHEGDVFGYASAKLENIGTQTTDTQNGSFLTYPVTFTAQQVEDPDSGSENKATVSACLTCILEKQPDGKWLISDLIPLAGE